MLSILISFALTLAASVETPLDSHSVPVPKDSLIPSYMVYSRHAAFGDDKLMVTDMNLTTSIPTLRLDNFPFYIQSISCTEDRIQISFYEQAMQAKAFEIWNDYDGLAFLVGHEHGCNGNDEGTILVYNLRIDPNNTNLIAEYDQVERDEVVEDWSAVISEQTPQAFYKSMYTREKVFNLNFDLDKFFKDIGDPGFSLYKQNLVHFQNCYTNGSVKYRLELHGHRRSLLSYKLKINGELNGTADVKIGFLPNQEITLFKTAVLTIPMTPLSIPGVLVVGPAFAIELGIAGFSDVELSIGFGFDFHLPIDYEIASKDMKSEPSNEIKDKAFFHPHPPKLTINTNATYVGGLINVIPEFVFGVQVMTQPILAIKGIFTNQLGMIHRFKSATACPDITSIEIFHRHFIGASITVMPAVWSWRFLDTGRRLLYASCKADAGNYQSPAASKFINASNSEFEVRR